MPRKLLKKCLPEAHKIRSIKGLGLLGRLLENPNLFHLNRRSVSVAVFAGIFIGFLPIPGQTVVAALAAFILGCNLPIAVLLIWFSNPLTFPVIFFGCYKLGSWMLGERYKPFLFEPTWEWFIHALPVIWQPLLLGCITAGLVFGTLGYAIVQLLWRWHVSDRWRQRRAKRRARKAYL